MTMKDIKPGQSFKVLGFQDGETAYRQKLLAMGITRGIIVKVTKVAPMGDPIQILLRGYTLSIRRDEASILKIEVVT